MTCNLSCWWSGSLYSAPGATTNWSLGGIDISKHYGIAICPIVGSVNGTILEILSFGCEVPNHIHVKVQNTGIPGATYTIQGITVG